MLQSHIEDLAKTAVKRGFSHSKFLTATELEQAKQRYTTRRDLIFAVEGGFENAERCIVTFRSPDCNEYMLTRAISALELAHRPQDIIAHRDVLGAVLALGLERDVLGDILIEPSRAILICMASVARFIAENLKSAGNVRLVVAEILLNTLPSKSDNYERISGTVASLRLDAVLAFAFKSSRELAQEKIAAGLVQLSHQICTQSTKIVEVGSVISLRGGGRVRLLEVSGLSQKERHKITIGKYM